MKNSVLRPSRVGIAAALGVILLILGTRTRAADSGFPIYFQDSKLIVKAESVNQTIYLPLLDIIRFLKLPYTDSIALETLTIRSGTSRLVLTKNSALISINDQIVAIPNPILHENGRWMAPVDFLTIGLTRLTGVEYRYRPGMPRIFAGDIHAPELAMNAQSLGSITRLTISIGTPSNVTLNRDDPHHTVLNINHAPLDPGRQSLDYRDRLVHGIAYDDSDGNSKISVDTSDEVADVHVTSAEGNQIFFVDFTRKAQPAEQPAAPSAPAAPAIASAPKTGNAVNPLDRHIRVVVIDPGHGGLDAGTKNSHTTEKDLTLALARKLRAALQSRLGMTALLTRDSDIDVSSETRSAVANNNQANLFISLHIGYSASKVDPGSSIFVMKEDFGGPVTAANEREPLFLPWYLGYRAARPSSVQLATLLQEELSKAIPGWKFPVRSAPLAVLSSAIMPSIALEIGNLNNPVNSQTLLDPSFQNRVANAIVDAIQRFSENSTAGGAGN